MELCQILADVAGVSCLLSALAAAPHVTSSMTSTHPAAPPQVNHLRGGQERSVEFLRGLVWT